VRFVIRDSGICEEEAIGKDWQVRMHGIGVLKGYDKEY